MRRIATALLVAACLGGCGGSKGLSREGLESRYVDELIEAGIDADVAECVIVAFFDELDDDDLRAFNTAGAELSPAQQERIAELSVDCTSA